MDSSKSKVRSTNTGVLQERRSKLGMGSRKLQKRKEQKASIKGNKSRQENKVSKRDIKEADTMEITVLVIFWGIVIVIAEIIKWVAAFHFAKYLPWIKAFMGGH